jgi:hypothetical protein
MPNIDQPAGLKPLSLCPTHGDTSIEVFRKHLIDTAQGIDASQVVSLACYHEWLTTRHGEINNPQQSFQRALTAHLTRYSSAPSTVTYWLVCLQI